MQISCEIIKDILPLYYDNACSEETKEMVKEHLIDCPDCREYLNEISETIAIKPEGKEAKEEVVKKNFLKKIKKKLFRKKVIVGFVSAMLGIAVVISAYSYMVMYEKPIEWEDGLATVTTNGKGLHDINFKGKDYSCIYLSHLTIKENGENKNIRLFYYTSSPWTRNFSKKIKEDARAFPAESYTSTNDEDWHYDDFDAIYYCVDDDYKIGLPYNQVREFFGDYEYTHELDSNNPKSIPENAVLLWEKDS